jgi:hypothetical protein
LFAVIGFPHSEHVAIRAARRVADHNHSIPEHPEADDSLLAVILARIFVTCPSFHKVKNNGGFSTSQRLGFLVRVMGSSFPWSHLWPRQT